MSDEFMTPAWIAERVNALGVTYDPAWHPLSPIRPRYACSRARTGPTGYDIEWTKPGAPVWVGNDGLVDHRGYLRGLTGRAGWPLRWDNPPYSDPLPWVNDAVLWASGGWRCALLLKLDPSTAVWRNFDTPGWLRGEFPRRLAFPEVVDGAYRPGTVAPFPSALVTNEPDVVLAFPECRWMRLSSPATATIPREPVRTSGRKRKPRAPSGGGA